ncbi:hypothetical protein PG989_005588 [Apiospora arundinis]
MAPVDPDGDEWVAVTASMPRGTLLSVYDNHEHYNPVLELLDADHRVIIIGYTNEFSQYVFAVSEMSETQGLSSKLTKKVGNEKGTPDPDQTTSFQRQSGCKVEVFYDGKAQDKPVYTPL